MTRRLKPEELRQMILDEINAYHDEKGRFSSEADAKIYSITQNAEEERGGLEKKRGKYSGGKVRSLYGANTGRPEKQCGKIDFKTGKRKRKTRSCQDYPRNYGQTDEDLDPISALPISDEEAGKTRTPQRRKDRKLPGSGALTSLANGIMEINGETYVSMSRLQNASRLIQEQQECPDHCIDAVLRLVQKVNIAQNPPKKK